MIVIGKYKELYGDQYKSIKELISNKPVTNKERIVRYLKAQAHVAYAPGILKDVITGERINGDMSTQTDGVYAWSSDLAYYVEKYNMKLPDDFIEHVLKQ